MSAGQLNQLSFKKETVWGTPVVPDKSVPVHFTGGFATNNDLQMVRGARGVLASNLEAAMGARVHEGDLEMDFFSDYPAYFFLSAIGAVVSALKGGESAVYTHTLTEAETKPSFTIEQVNGDNVRRYAGCIATGFSIELGAGGLAQITFPMKAKNHASATKITPAYRNDPVFDFGQAAVKIGGTQVGQVASLAIEYRNNIEFLHTLNNTNDPSFNFVKGSELSGSMDIYLDSTTLAEYTAFINKTNKALVLELTGAAIGTSSNNKVVLTIPKAYYTTGETRLSDDYNLLRIEWEAMYDPATSKMFDMVITNTLASLA